MKACDLLQQYRDPNPENVISHSKNERNFRREALFFRREVIYYLFSPSSRNPLFSNWSPSRCRLVGLLA